jgi:hypothetical protein
LAKGRSRRNREARKPKAAKQPVQAASTFLRPQPASSLPATKDSKRQVDGKAEQLDGKLQNSVGSVKDTLHR